ncbi:MAG: hypothetical protein FWD57_05785 [Polyangiaceae bacterium]|nr:hypothetical protein [Polyangiaceae bacterium]
MKSLLKFGIVCMSVLALSACSSDDDDDEGTKTDPCEGKTEGASCGDNKVCNAEGACVPDETPGPCESNDECDGDQVCNDQGECVDPPASDPECDETHPCDGDKICNDQGECVDPE